MADNLSVKGVEKIIKSKKRGTYGDGGGLYLQIAKGGSATWTFRYTLGGKRRAMGLGSAHTVDLAEARDLATDARRLVTKQIDPIEERERHRRSIALADSANKHTFQHCAEQYIKAFEASWKNPTHRLQWSSTLGTYAYPVIGHLPVDQITTDHVMKIIQPLWIGKTETGRRLRGRIETIMDWAKTKGYRAGENPAMWRGNLALQLPARSKVQRVKHMPALPYDALPDFMADLADRDGDGARCLELTILTAVRSGSARGALRSEFDLEKKTWTIPGERMKAGKEFVVALSEKAIAVVKAQPKDREFLFEGDRKGTALSEGTMLKVIERMGLKGKVTPHGFRSTFKDWASEATDHADIVSEMALAHTIGDQVQRAYRRGNLLEKRFDLMNDWARHAYRDKRANLKLAA